MNKFKGITRHKNFYGAYNLIQISAVEIYWNSEHRLKEMVALLECAVLKIDMGSNPG